MIGPTPPGTFEMRDAREMQSSRSTSPQSFPVSGSRLTPTSMITAPGLTMSFLTSLARPMAGTRMSAEAQICARSRVREWTMVTVAFSLRRSFETGSPTMFDRPMTTILRPSSGMLLYFRSSTMACGVHGATHGRPCHSAATLRGWKPSTSLNCDIVSMTRSPLMWRGSGICTSMPSTVVSALRVCICWRSWASVVVSGKRRVLVVMPTDAAVFMLPAT